MSGAKKIMNTLETICISETEKKAAMAMLEGIPIIDIDDALVEYRATLDEYCKMFNSDSHHDLMVKADELEFEPTTCTEILEKYSFIQRHQQ